MEASLCPIILVYVVEEMSNADFSHNYNPFSLPSLLAAFLRSPLCLKSVSWRTLLGFLCSEDTTGLLTHVNVSFRVKKTWNELRRSVSRSVLGRKSHGAAGAGAGVSGGFGDEVVEKDPVNGPVLWAVPWGRGWRRTRWGCVDGCWETTDPQGKDRGPCDRIWSPARDSWMLQLSREDLWEGTQPGCGDFSCQRLEVFSGHGVPVSTFQVTEPRDGLGGRWDRVRASRGCRDQHLLCSPSASPSSLHPHPTVCKTLKLWKLKTSATCSEPASFTWLRCGALK